MTLSTEGARPSIKIPDHANTAAPLFMETVTNINVKVAFYS
jgi:hypothetical protein